ncbi:MAG TPA: hypothetical protein PKH03_04940 [Syntrophales bacterium]|nr:hypothetical protein [Syntrophales bacterium]
MLQGLLDGSRGPAGVVRPGAVRIARETDAAVVPFYTTAEHAWYFRSWDRFMIPKPFSRVTLRFGEMLRFHADVGEEGFEAQWAMLEAVMLPALIFPEYRTRRP